MLGDAAHVHALDLSNEIAGVHAPGFRLKGGRLWYLVYMVQGLGARG